MPKEIGIEPMIFHGPGGCPKCGDLLTVVDNEMTVMNLDRDGNPTSEETIFKAKGFCPNCGYTLEMERWGGKYLPYGRSAHILRLEAIREKIKQRRLDLDAESKGKNPFALD